MSRGWLIEQEESEVELMVSQNAIPSILRSQIVMSNEYRMGLRRPPYAFTEQGVGLRSRRWITERSKCFQGWRG